MSINVVIGVSHKTYLGYGQTRAWCQQVAEIVQPLPQTLTANLQLFTFPAMPALSVALQCFAKTPMATGAQNVCAADSGPWTGESSASMLYEMGCQYVEIGHAERRRYFGENVETINQKLDRALASGLTPVICIGEDRQMSAEQATTFAIAQVDELLAHRDKQSLPAAIFAWEPQWAIGAPQPASDDYIRHICRKLRAYLHGDYGKQLQVIYGGSAGPGLLSRLWPDVDGLFLGRFAHQPQAMAAIIAEAQQIVSAHQGNSF
ncbi:triosephosphate isomerase [Rahnella sp. SAP-1]|uniref:Triosephosphate isomerase n=1 Tax=Rouxiella aceris TaxID=2703884 RepID=A0A848ME06_9GAMM|nr:triose-phosphate isomerase family protein [Rouxiella aceris]NMP25421.1 triosephosphate isomerase [Rouxiella aceris]